MLSQNLVQGWVKTWSKHVAQHNWTKFWLKKIVFLDLCLLIFLLNLILPAERRRFLKKNTKQRKKTEKIWTKFWLKRTAIFGPSLDSTTYIYIHICIYIYLSLSLANSLSCFLPLSLSLSSQDAKFWPNPFFGANPAKAEIGRGAPHKFHQNRQNRRGVAMPVFLGPLSAVIGGEKNFQNRQNHQNCHTQTTPPPWRRNPQKKRKKWGAPQFFKDSL